MKGPFRRFVYPAILAVSLFGFTGELVGQNRLSKTLLNTGIRSISIDASLCYRIVLETGNDDEVSVDAQMDGEYGNDLVVLFREEGSTLFIEPRFRPEFQLPDDKLGAHKVVSISMRIGLPPNQNVMLTGSTCDIQTSGRFRDLGIVINDGSCQLGHSAENTKVRTGSASIRATVGKGVVEARSGFGEVSLDPIPQGDHHMQLMSTRGNISVHCCL
jgi:hypothetical protein